MLFEILGFLIWPIFIIGGIGFFISRRRRKSGGHAIDEKNWYFQLAFSKEDAASQFFFLLTIFFLGITLTALNRDLGDLITWQTIILFTSVIGIIGAYFFKALYVLPFSLIGLASWWGIKAAEWIEITGSADIKGSAIYAGLMLFVVVLYLLGKAHEKEIKFKRFSLVYTIIGLISITGSLFFLSTRGGLRGLEEMTEGASIFGSWQIAISLLFLIVGVLLVMFYVINNKLIAIPEAAVLTILSIFFIVLAVIPELNIFEKSGLRSYYYTKEFTSNGIIWAFFLNIFIFLEVLGVIFSGYLHREKWLINLGVFFMFLLILVKYFDWFFEFFDKSIFFISAGIILFMVGWFMEKGRKYMISEMQKEEHAINQ